MGSNRRREAEALFQQIADLPRERRASYLQEHAAGDAALLGDVERLLERFENGAVAALDAVERLDELGTDLIGECVGPYRLLELIGEGGFGAVYRAEQDAPVRRIVALKIIKLGMDTKQVIARFEAERQALALMEHPNIARVFDAGSTDTGRPYFVMELIRGIPITEYCDQHQLPTRERLQLAADVCRAVHHAHQRGIIHRDIKPSNVLVTRRDGAPVPVVIDFGIAKATADRLTDQSLFTNLLQFIGTPQYMSPEQAAIGGLDVDTRTDVYSLGVLLYELLTGTTPIDKQILQRADLSELQRIIRGQEPPTPSRRVRTLDDRMVDMARVRRTVSPSLGRQLCGDLDWIVMKALEKERDRRYDGAASLAEDLERFLNHEPVLAGPTGTSYRLRKFVRRNRVAVISGVLIGLVTLAGLTATTVGFVQARREADSARAISEFLDAMLISADPLQMRVQSVYAPDMPLLPPLVSGSPRDVSVAEMVLGASARIERSFSGKPQLAATAHETIGFTLRGLGRFKEAEQQLRSALEIRRRVLGPSHPDTSRSLLAVGDLLVQTGRGDEGEKLVRMAYEEMRRVLGDEHIKTLSCASILACTLADTGAFEESDRLFERTLDAQRRRLGHEHPDTLITMWKWSCDCVLRGELARGEQLARSLADITRRTRSPDHDLNLLLEPLRAWWHISHHRYDQAAKMLRPGLSHCRRILGENNPFTFLTMRGLARALQGGDLQEKKEQLYRAALVGLRKIRGDLHWQTIAAANDLAAHLNERGKFEEAEAMYRELVVNSSKAHGEDDDLALEAMESLGYFLEKAGKFDESVAARRHRLAVLRRILEPESAVLGREQDLLAKALLRMGRISEGREATQALIDSARDVATAQPGRAELLNAYARTLLTCDPPDMRDVGAALTAAERAAELSEWKSPAILDTLARARHLAGDNDKAVELQRRARQLSQSTPVAKALYGAGLGRYLCRGGEGVMADGIIAETVAQCRKAIGEDHPQLAMQLHGVSMQLGQAEYYRSAEALLREALELYRRDFGEEHERIAESSTDLARFLAVRGEFEQSERAYRNALRLRRHLLGDDHLVVAETWHALGSVLHEQGKADEAREMLVNALNAYRRLRAEDAPDALRLKRLLADACVASNHVREADALAREALAKLKPLYGQKHVETARALATMGRLLMARGEPAQAEAYLRQSLDIHRESAWQERHRWRIAMVEGALGHCLTALGHFEQAESLLLRSHDAIRIEKGDAFAATREAAQRLVGLYEGWNRPEKAVHWRDLAKGHTGP